MNEIDLFFDGSPYSMSADTKQEILTKYLVYLTDYHKEHCIEYRNILTLLGYDSKSINSYYDLPFLPVRLFKDFLLSSVQEQDVLKTMTSSGTTGQSVSKIYLDGYTSTLQSKALMKIVSDFIGTKRMPMIVLDTAAVVKNREKFSARGAGIRGFSLFGRDIIYAFDDQMNLNYELINKFLDKHKNEKIFLYGFTFMIWQHLCMQLKKENKKIDFSNGVLIHGGGWKKLVDLNISTERFKMVLEETCGISKVYDYYGMVEQTGSIYMECECGFFHASNYSDVIIRRKEDFTVADYGELGIIEVVSILPHSYPGHVLLTEDEGVVLGEDDCACGRKGKYFKVNGRIKNAEIRGCSDTYASRF